MDLTLAFACLPAAGAIAVLLGLVIREELRVTRSQHQQEDRP